MIVITMIDTETQTTTTRAVSKLVAQAIFQAAEVGLEGADPESTGLPTEVIDLAWGHLADITEGLRD